MVRNHTRRTRLFPALVVVTIAGIVGCGGGGAGSKSVVIGGSNGGNGGADGTTGEITTGGTTGVEVTTGGGFSTTGSTAGTTAGVITTGSMTTGDADTTGTDATTGTTANVNTTGNPTTGSGTTSSTDTTGTTSTNGTASTSGTGTTGAASTAGSGTTGTTGGSATTGTTGTDGSTGTTGTTGTAGSGGTTGGAPSPTLYRYPNTIYFGHYGDASVVSSIRPDGSGREDLNGGDGDVGAVVPDPAGGFLYAKTVDGKVGVYRGATYDVASSTVLAPAQYDSVSAIQTSANGAVLMVAGTSGVTKAYLLVGGTITEIDDAEDAAVTIDGSTVAYTKNVGGYTDLFVWDRATGLSTPLDTGGDAILPSFSKDGAWIVFSSTRDRGFEEAYDLYQVPTAGGGVQRITNTPYINELGACYNEARTMISYVGISSHLELAGLYVLSNAGSTRIAPDADLNLATYWTDAQGRSIRRTGGRFQRLHTKRRR